MAREWEDEMFEDEACLECGDVDYNESKLPGICLDCYNSLTRHPSHATYATADQD